MPTTRMIRPKAILNAAVLCAALGWTACVAAQTIEPYQAKPVQPYHSGQVQEYHSSPVQEYHGRSSSAIDDSGLSGSSSSYSGSGFEGLSYAVPGGWKTQHIKDMLALTPQGLDSQQKVVIILMPPKPLRGEPMQNFFTRLDERFQSKNEVEQETPVRTLHTRQGYDALYRVVHFRADHGGSYQVYTTFQQGSSIRLVMFLAGNHELYERYKSDLSGFLDSVSLSNRSDSSSSDSSDLDLPSSSNGHNSYSGGGQLRTSGNLVEPLSNGLRLSMSCDDIQHQFGPPPHPTWDARTFGYDDFGLSCGGAGNHIWTLTLTGPVRLHSGIGVGSSRRDVMRVFGEPISATSGQYKLHFDYNGDRVSRISIRPAYGTFRASNDEDGARQQSGASQNQSEDQSERQSEQPSDQSSSSASRFVGTWQGLTVPGQIVIRANGTYTFGGAEGGRYRVSGNDIYFGGEPLRAWDHGHATLSSQGNLEFYWTNPDGSKNYFAFGK